MMLSFSRLAFLACAGIAASVVSANSLASGGPVEIANSTRPAHIGQRAIGSPFDSPEALLVRQRFEEHLRREMESQELNGRGIGGLIRGAAKVIESVVNLVKNKINKDKARRGEFTKHVVEEGRKQKSDMNWVICHVKHRTQWKGNRGTDWDHSHQEFDVSFHKTIGYEIYWAREGEFWRQGDGGYLNWAYSGKFTVDPKDAGHITFQKF